MSIVSRLLVLLPALTLACGGATPKGKTAEQKKAEADKKAQDAKDAEAIAKRKAKREAEEKAKAEAEAKLESELERLCVLPEKLPKDPVAACEAVGQAHDAYIRRLGDPDAIAKWDAEGKEKTIPMTVVRCTQADSVKAAACQKHALDGAGPELKDNLTKLMQTCIDKFPSRSRPKQGVPKRRPG